MRLKYAAYFYRCRTFRNLSVCVLGTRVSRAKTAEAISTPQTRVDQRNHVSDGVHTDATSEYA